MEKYNFIGLLTFTSLVICLFICNAEKIRFLSTEHPRVTHCNQKYFSYYNVTSRRYGRGDPFYYIGIYVDAVVGMGNNITVDIYVYEWLTNVYKRSFVELHFGLCDLIHKNKYFGSALKQGKASGTCPYPPGVYNLYNVTIPMTQIPRAVPFTKGRIYCNLSDASTQESVVTWHIDMEIKEVHVKQKKNYY